MFGVRPFSAMDDCEEPHLRNHSNRMASANAKQWKRLCIIKSITMKSMKQGVLSDNASRCALFLLGGTVKDVRKDILNEIHYQENSNTPQEIHNRQADSQERSLQTHGNATSQECIRTTSQRRSTIV